jgi:hypothetical protein
MRQMNVRQFCDKTKKKKNPIKFNTKQQPTCLSLHFQEPFLQFLKSAANSNEKFKLETKRLTLWFFDDEKKRMEKRMKR